MKKFFSGAANIFVKLTVTLAACFLSVNSFAGFYEDVVHSGGRFHSVKWVVDPEEDFASLCKKWVSEHSDGGNWVSQCDDGRFVGGYMCDKWSNNNNVWECTGQSWYLEMSKCGRNTLYHREQGCVPVITEIKDKPNRCDVPGYGNPIYPSRAQKLETVMLDSLNGWPLELKYASSTGKGLTASPVDGSTAPWLPFQLPGFGPNWTLSFISVIELQRGVGEKILPLQRVDAATHVHFELFDGGGVYHNKPFSSELSTANFSGYSDWKLRSLAGLYVEKLDSIQGYGESGKAIAPLYRAGIGGDGIQWTYSVAADVPSKAPSAGLPIQLTDHFGRKIHFDYELVEGGLRIVRMRQAAGWQTEFEYSTTGQLKTIIWPDGSRRLFHYEVPSRQDLLTGITDEKGVRHSTYGYTVDGYAQSTELAGRVNRFEANYIQVPQQKALVSYDPLRKVFVRTIYWEVGGSSLVGPGGGSIEIAVAAVDGRPEVTAMSQPAGAGCQVSHRRQQYDAAGNVSWREDFNGYRTCFSNDVERNLEIGRVEGLSANSACDSIVGEGAVLPFNARRISTKWHPIWHLRAKVAEPRRLTTKVYNGQPDPFNGGASAWCAPSNATLPDGSPIVVLCKQVEQATTDPNGALGFSAGLDAAVPARVQQWTYNQYGQVLTTKDPLNNTTTQTYYGSTGADSTMGDLATVTNALNQVVARYTKYNPAGQWLEMLDANGVATTRTFDPRQRLKSITTAGLTTSYDYWPTGLLKAITLPDASSVSYGYDDAHRLTSITDNLGNKITYTLDNSGHRIGEEVADPVGRLAKTLTRVPDALNRIQQVAGRE